MTLPLQTLIAAAAGALLGVVFFFGLWLTLDGIAQARHPVLRLMASLFLRFGAVLAGFYVIVRLGGWPHVLAGAAGLTAVRLVLVRRLGPRPRSEEPAP